MKRSYLILLSIFFLTSAYSQQWVNYNSQGTKIVSGDTVNGKVRFWRDNGQLGLVGHFKDTARNGKWKYFDEEGRLFKLENYTNGVKKFSKEYTFYQSGKASQKIETWFKGSIENTGSFKVIRKHFVYYENGKRCAEFQTENEHNIVMKYWNEKGEMIDKEEWEKILKEKR